MLHTPDFVSVVSTSYEINKSAQTLPPSALISDLDLLHGVATSGVMESLLSCCPLCVCCLVVIVVPANML
jgi:hypothetical protein